MDHFVGKIIPSARFFSNPLGDLKVKVASGFSAFLTLRNALQKWVWPFIVAKEL